MSWWNRARIGFRDLRLISAACSLPQAFAFGLWMTRTVAALHNTRRTSWVLGSFLPMQHFAFISSVSIFAHVRGLTLYVACVLACLSGSDIYAQNANDNAAGNSARAQQQRQAKRVTPLRSSETADGSRVTLTADVPLNDYAAYRNGNRFIVVVPGAAGSGGGSGVNGRGFEDVQVQRRGNDLVYSFRLKPGAKARVNQRFNRLDVEFAAPEGEASSATTNANRAPANVTQSETRPSRQATTNTSSTAPGTTTSSRTSASNTPARRTEEIASDAQPQVAPVLLPSPSDVSQPVLNPTPATSGTPPDNELAQVQTPPTTVPAPPTTTAVTTTAQTPTIGAVVARNWGWGVVLLLALLFGLGLFYATRSSRTRALEPPPASAPPASAPLAGSELPRADDLILPAAGTGATIASATTMTSPAPVAQPVAPIVPAAVAAALVASSTEPKTPRQVVAPDDADLDDAEIVQAEVQKLLTGDDFNEKIIISAGDYARSIVTAELVTALSSSSTMRRDAAHKAFVSYGYLEQVGSDLHDARTSAERAAAARTLGLIKSHAATSYLVRALEDKSPEVRRAAVEALAEIRDPAAVPALQARRDREKRRDMPKQLINRAIAACAAGKPAPSVAQAALLPTDLRPTETSPQGSHVDTDGGVSSVSEFVPDETQPIASPVVLRSEEVVTEAQTIESSTPAIESAQLTEEVTAQYGTPHVEELDSATTPAIGTPAVSEAQEPAMEVAEPTLQTEAATLIVAPPAQLAETTSLDEQTIEHQAVRVEDRRDDHAVAEITDSTFDTKIETAPSKPVIASVTAPQATEDEWVDLNIQESGATAFAEGDVTLVEAMPVETLVAPGADETTLIADEATLIAEETAFVAEEPFVQDHGLAAIGAPTASPFAEEDDLAGLAPISTSAAEEEATEAQAETTEAAVVDAASPVNNYSGIPEGVRMRLVSANASERASGIGELGALHTDEALQVIYAAFDDSSPEVHVAAVHALHTTEEDRTNAFTRALREATPERRRNIGSAISASGLAAEAINNLAGESREKTYEAFSLLFLMAKAGEFSALLKAIEHNPNIEVRLAVVKLLALSGQPEVLPAFRRLAVRGSLPAEVRSAVMEAIYQIANQGAANAG